MGIYINHNYCTFKVSGPRDPGRKGVRDGVIDNASIDSPIHDVAPIDSLSPQSAGPCLFINHTPAISSILK